MECSNLAVSAREKLTTLLVYGLPGSYPDGSLQLWKPLLPAKRHEPVSEQAQASALSGCLPEMRPARQKVAVSIVCSRACVRANAVHARQLENCAAYHADSEKHGAHFCKLRSTGTF